jgi:hypothetical protein
VACILFEVISRPKFGTDNTPTASSVCDVCDACRVSNCYWTIVLKRLTFRPIAAFGSYEVFLDVSGV